MAWEEFDRKTASRTKDPTMTIQRRGTISLSGPAVDLLVGSDEKADKISVDLLYDADRELVGIRLAHQDNPNPHLLRRQGRSEVYLVSGTLFCAHYDIDTSVARRYRAKFHDGILGVRLSDPHAKVGRRVKDEKNAAQEKEKPTAENPVPQSVETRQVSIEDPWTNTQSEDGQ